MYLDKKGFKWSIMRYDEDGITFQFTFEFPTHISVGEIDTMKIQFFNTDRYLKPQNGDKSSIPDGYTVVIKLPPQGGDDAMSPQELENNQETGQQIVIVQLILSQLLSQVLAMVFGSILVVQIMAHLPLTDINLPVNVLQTFQVIISFVSFDYFPPFNYIDAGFTEVWPFSSNFDWIGYQSVNFLLGIGSIGIFAAVRVATILIALFACRIRCPCKWARKTFSSHVVWAGSVAFIHVTFFELMISGATGSELVQYWDHLNSADHTSIALTVVFMVILGLYLLFGLYFVFFKSGPLMLVSKAEEEERNLERCELIHESLI